MFWTPLSCSLFIITCCKAIWILNECNCHNLPSFMICSLNSRYFQEQLNWEHRARRFPAKSNLQSDATFVADKVNLGEDGWKERYYTEKFEAQSDDDRETVKKDAVRKPSFYILLTVFF
ncbi:hypothetical protein SASPL_103315 [Salvia splendens]|uniref:Xrn1 helical domain-containing protein n=1 Tax=Salvia splendens TaxID=180675 RepID=A0A8X9AEG4_SALSN|nr:hypothetical protein SASPL_103315 [Salvia splendens]